MELKILSPQEGGFVKEIQWNYEELKAEITEKLQDYKTLVFTEETIKEAKADRAKLNKLKTVFEDERKRIKRQCMQPYEAFEKQVKELISLIDEPIQLIDSQIKEVEQAKKEDKRKAIIELIENIEFQSFVSLEQIWDEKWLNATMSMNRIGEQLQAKKLLIDKEIESINNLPEFSFEAMEVYKDTLDLTKAIQEGQRLSEIQKRKAACEEERRKKAEGTEKQVTEGTEPRQQESFSDIQTESEPVLCLDFRAWGTREQLMKLRQYMVDNNIRFGKVE